MSIQHAEAAMYTRDIEEQVAGYAPVMTLNTLQLKSDGSAFVSVQVAGESQARGEFFVEKTVDLAAQKVKDKIRSIFTSLAN